MASNCNTCSSANSSLCIQCQTGYYLVNSNCLISTSLVSNCDTYNNNNNCSSCLSGYYLINNQCLPCSMNCLVCTAGDFGSCSICASGYTLFNLICLPNNFITTNSYQLYYHIPAYLRYFSGGALQTCS